MDAGSIRRWAAQREAMAEREKQETREHGISVEESLRDAFKVIDFYGQLHGWPPAEDPVSAREDLLAYEAWTRLRACRRT